MKKIAKRKRREKRKTERRQSEKIDEDIFLGF